LLLTTNSYPLSLAPNFELGLEISEALPDEFNVQNTGHAVLILAERLKL